MQQPKIDFLGHVVREPIAVKADERFIINLKVKFDPETGSTTPDESDKVDLVDLIQTYKDQCGMELAQRLLRTGQADPSQFADDGKHSGDVPEGYDNPQTLANAALVAKGNADVLAQALGLPDNAATLSDEQLAAIIGKTIMEKYPNLIKKEETPNAE